MRIQNNRLCWIDIAKGLSIILMVLGHIPGIPGILRVFIFSFHMPLFMIVNGYFTHRYNVARTFHNSVRSLLVPYCAVCVIEALMCMFQAGDVEQAGVSFLNGLNDMVVGMSKSSRVFLKYGSVWLVWFVICLFAAKNMYVTIRKLLNRKPAAIQYGALLFVACTGWFIKKYYGFLPWSLDVAMVCVVFIAAGDYLRDHEKLFDNMWLLSACAGFWILCVFNGQYIELAQRIYPYFFLGLLEALAGTFVVLRFSRLLERITSASHIFSWYGRHSMMILAVHCFEMRFFRWNDWIFSPFGMHINWIMEFVIRFVFISAVSWFIIRMLAYSKQRAEAENREADLNQSNRLAWADIAKGICIISVILGHLGVGFLNRLVFMYHLPVFFLLAGYFMKVKPDRTVVSAKAKRLLIPYGITCLVVCMIAAIQKLPDITVSKQVFFEWAEASLYGAGDSWQEPYLIRGIGAIWFLPALFFALVIVNGAINSNRANWLIPIIAFVGWASFEHTKVWLPFSIQAGMLASLYVYIGYLAKVKQFSLQKEHPMILVGMFLLAAWSIQYFKGFWLVHNYMGNGWIDFIASICASCIIILGSFRIANNTWITKKILQFFGHNSLIIMCAHLVDLDVLQIPQLSNQISSFLQLNANHSLMLLIALRIVYVVLAVLIINSLCGLLNLNSEFRGRKVI